LPAALDEVVLVPLPAADPVAAVPDAGAAVVVPVAAEEVGCAVVVEVAFVPAVVAVEAFVLLPSVTAPRFVTL
jgi:hypothetical protein